MPLRRRGRHRAFERYILATVVAFAALYARELFLPYLGDRNPYHFAWLAVVISAWYCGLLPSILTLVIEIFGVWYLFLTPTRSFHFENRPEAIGLLGFALLSGLIVVFGEVNRRSIARKDAAENEVVHEIEARLRAEKQAQVASEVAQERTRSESRFRGLLESAPDGMVIVNAEGRVVLINAQTERLFGYPRTELLGQAAEMLIPEHDRTEYRARLQACFQAPHAQVPGASLELRGLRKDGTEFPTEVSLSPLETQGETMVSSGVRDITERHAAQETVKEQAKLLDAANDSIFVCDARGRIVYWNGGATRLYGWSKEEAIGKVSHDLLHTEFPVPFEEIVRNLQKSGWEGDLIHQRRDGARVTVASRWTLLKDAQHEFAGWLAVNRDISARKQLENSLREISGRLLQMQDEERRRISRELHDSVGQSIVALKLGLDSLKSMLGKKCDESEQELLAGCGDLAEEAMKEVRTMSYLMHPPMLDEMGLKSAVSWYVEGFAKRTGIQATADILPNFGRLPSEVEIALFRVIQESLTNVHRHSGSNTAHVRLLRKNRTVALEVEDHGKGISLSAAPDSRTSLPSTLGVGLQGMNERIRQLGGKLEVQGSEQGTIIRATVPYSNGTSDAIYASAALPSKTGQPT